MKWLWFSGGAAVVIVGGVAFFAFGIISKFHEADRRLREAYEQHALTARWLGSASSTSREGQGMCKKKPIFWRQPAVRRFAASRVK